MMGTRRVPSSIYLEARLNRNPVVILLKGRLLAIIALILIKLSITEEDHYLLWRKKLEV